MDVTNHPNWLTFARELDLANNYPRVIIYINIRLSHETLVYKVDNSVQSSLLSSLV